MLFRFFVICWRDMSSAVSIDITFSVTIDDVIVFVLSLKYKDIKGKSGKLCYL